MHENFQVLSKIAQHIFAKKTDLKFRKHQLILNKF